MTRHEKRKTGRGSPRTLTAVSVGVLEQSLRGLDFPAGKEDILLKAEENTAPDDVFFALDQLEDRYYSNLDDILQELQ